MSELLPKHLPDIPVNPYRHFGHCQAKTGAPCTCGGLGGLLTRAQHATHVLVRWAKELHDTDRPSAVVDEASVREVVEVLRDAARFVESFLPTVAASQSEYKRLKALGVNVLPPAE